MSSSNNGSALEINYSIFQCKEHKIHILYFPSTKILEETVCWDCIRSANAKKEKQQVADKEKIIQQDEQKEQPIEIIEETNKEGNGADAEK